MENTGLVVQFSGLKKNTKRLRHEVNIKSTLLLTLVAEHGRRWRLNYQSYEQIAQVRPLVHAVGNSIIVHVLSLELSLGFMLLATTVKITHTPV